MTEKERTAYQFLRKTLDGKQSPGVIQCIPAEIKDTQGYMVQTHQLFPYMQRTQPECKLTEQELVGFVRAWSQSLEDVDWGKLATLYKEMSGDHAKVENLVFISTGKLQTLKNSFQ